MKRRSPNPRIPAWSAIVLPALVALAGCAPAEPPLARVGGQPITVADFQQAARLNAHQYIGMGDAGKTMLIQALVTRKLFVLAAKQQRVYDDSTFLDYGRDQREQLQRQLLFREIAGGDIPVSEPEAHAAYERRRFEAHARLIFTPDETTAREAAREIASGADFADVARRFNSIGALPEGGDIGFVAPGNLVQPLDDWLETAPIGKVMGPEESKGQGWFLMRVEARRKAELPPYPQVHDQLVALLRQRKQRAWLLRNSEWLKQAYDVRLLPGAANLFVDHVKHQPDPTHFAPLSLEDAAQPIATWSGGSYTLGDAWTALQRPGQTVPNVNMMPTVQRWLENQLFDRVMLAEAGAQRLVDDPEPARTLDERLDGYLLDAYYNRAVIGAVQITDADLRAAFERDPDAFAQLISAEVMSLTLPESLTTESFVMHVGHAASLRDAAQMVGLAASLKQETVRFPTTDPMWQALAVRLRSMRPGEYAGPFPGPQGEVIIQLVSKQQHAPSFEQLTVADRQQLQTDLVNLKRSERQRAVDDSLRRAIPVSVDTAAVRRTPWPMEALMSGFGTGG